MPRAKKTTAADESQPAKPKKETAKAKKEPVKKAAKKPVAVQPEVNIGLVGHVDHGKTTLTERLSGKWTDTHSEELKRGITIRLGYADTMFFKCTKCKSYSVKPKCKCGGEGDFVRKVSFVDAPGHESLMATMLAGTTIMNGALLLIAANETCPQPQTREHLMALQIMGVKNVIVVQNKIDVVKEDDAMKNYEQIKAFLKGTEYENAPVIPISALHNVNIDLLIETIEKVIPTPKLDATKDPLFFVARSFDINKPGSNPDKIVGGIIGGSLFQGKLRVGDQIEMRPGYAVEFGGRKQWKSIFTNITGLKTGGESVEEILPGGSVGIMTDLDPAIVKSDTLTGSVVGYKDKLPPVWNTLKLETHLLERVVGAKEDLVVEPIKMSEPLMLNVNSAATVGVVTELSKNAFTCILKLPICAKVGSRVTISRRLGARFRLIGYGMIKQ
ncbi:translation initiation factor IF-2 subunit gamma [Candidatus Woesearchaeota archaeon]|nr:translation initiation factor IF-2 subunit gamma [Candidatus Woesearchaeota archaeon]